MWSSWPLREVLEAFRQLVRRRAWDQYKFEAEMYARQAPFATKRMTPPKFPTILRGSDAR